MNNQTMFGTYLSRQSINTESQLRVPTCQFETGTVCTGSTIADLYTYDFIENIYWEN